MLKVFIHAWGRDEHGLSILREIIMNIIMSGLYDEVDNIHAFISGSNQYTVEAEHCIGRSGAKFSIEKYAPGDASYERLTLCNIHKYVKEDDKVLYLHTKGASHSDDDVRIDDWRFYMSYYCIRHYKKCIELLDKYDTVGSLYRMHPWPHWSGAYYWATGKHWLKSPKEIPDDYYAPEREYPFGTDPRPTHYEMGSWESLPPWHNAHPKPPHMWVDKKME
jgi:hypothetical protein